MAKCVLQRESACWFNTKQSPRAFFLFFLRDLRMVKVVVQRASRAGIVWCGTISAPVLSPPVSTFFFIFFIIVFGARLAASPCFQPPLSTLFVCVSVLHMSHHHTHALSTLFVCVCVCVGMYVCMYVYIHTNVQICVTSYIWSAPM